jgi:hypothetical protein
MPPALLPFLLHCCLIPAAAAAAPQQKKSKKQAASAGKKQLAVVGDAQLAATRPPLVRDLYNEHPEVAAMSAQQVQELHESRRTAVEGCDLRPVVSFEQTGLPANMLHATRDFVSPSPIQSQCWPIILSGHDMIGIAATGSGKTLAFGLPMLRHIQAQREGGVVTGKGPVALVMAPTRELALQIAAVLEDAGSKCGIGSVCVYGGVPKHPQVSALRSGVDIVVGTPGRLEDLLQDGACKLQVGACGYCSGVAGLQCMRQQQQHQCFKCSFCQCRGHSLRYLAQPFALNLLCVFNQLYCFSTLLSCSVVMRINTPWNDAVINNLLTLLPWLCCLLAERHLPSARRG